MSEHSDSTPCPVRRYSRPQDISISQFPIPNLFNKATAAESNSHIVPVTDLQKAFKEAAPRWRKMKIRPTGPLEVYEDQEGSEAQYSNSDTTSHGQTEDLARGLQKRPRRQRVDMPAGVLSNEASHLETRVDVIKNENRIPKPRPFAGRSGSRYQTGQGKTFAVAQQREPLQLSNKMLQSNGESIDHAGRNTGKENIPPGQRVIVAHKCGKSNHGETYKTDQPKSTVLLKKKNLHPGTNAIGIASGSRLLKSSPTLPVAGDLTIRKAALPRRKSKPEVPSEIVDSKQLEILKKQDTLKFVNNTARDLPKLGTASISKPTTHLLLPKDISEPQIFENSWLSHQESIMTELANRTLRTRKQPCMVKPIDKKALRKGMIKLYQTESMSMLGKRLQASLSYGTLSRPKESSLDFSQFVSDVRMRLQFLDFWTMAYSIDVLTLAAEIVVGQELSSPQVLNELSKAGGTLRRKRPSNRLALFIETYLLCNEDAPCSEYPEVSSPSGGCGLNGRCTKIKGSLCWRRTMQRCLMMIALIDKAKELKIICTNVFRKSSSIKTSSAMIIRLAALLMPWMGNVLSPLSYLDYRVAHRQSSLAEYDYSVKNLATDLRDGIQLTHIVELLIYSKIEPVRPDEDIAMRLQPREVLTAGALDQGHLPLSQSLKYPCQGKPSRLFNVQIALGALRKTVISSMIRDIRPKDIVDGHREKTLKLLWALVGNLGLECLIDWNDLNWEIRRQQRTAKQENIRIADVVSNDYEGTLPIFQPHADLLQIWAKFVAWNHGLRGSGLTASFTDEKILECVVDEYYAYVRPIPRLASEITHVKLSLNCKLKRLGCSSTFISIFDYATHGGQLRDRDYLTATLAFLASRLLEPSREHRCTKLIQDAWHRAKLRRTIRQRCILMRVAHDCKRVVQNRKRATYAAVVVQRAWRAYWARHFRKCIDGMMKISWREECSIEGKSFLDNEEDVDIWLIDLKSNE